MLAPVFLRGIALRPVHVLAAVAGFAGAALAIVGGRDVSGGLAWGYLAAAGSAFIWASYSLLTQRVAHFPTAAIGLFGLVSGLLALACHALLEPAVALSTRDMLLIGVVGLGPLGAAFFLWDAALKRSDARRIGLLSYLTPLASTLLLALTTARPLTPWIAARGAPHRRCGHRRTAHALRRRAHVGDASLRARATARTSAPPAASSRRRRGRCAPSARRWFPTSRRSSPARGSR